ncbi:MAG: hypothetical protein K2O82_04265, partial [Alistipes sp.]|nr:hypothetical protein [Alistipes sp.]
MEFAENRHSEKQKRKRGFKETELLAEQLLRQELGFGKDSESKSLTFQAGTTSRLSVFLHKSRIALDSYWH